MGRYEVARESEAVRQHGYSPGPFFYPRRKRYKLAGALRFQRGWTGATVRHQQTHEESNTRRDTDAWNNDAPITGGKASVRVVDAACLRHGAGF